MVEFIANMDYFFQELSGYSNFVVDGLFMLPLKSSL